MKSSVTFIVSILAVLGLLSGCAEKDQLEDGSKLINEDQFVSLPQVNSSHSVMSMMT